MIYDGFTFFNELDLLELRLETLYKVVDKFIIVESARTFTNEPKPLYFENNRDRYNKFLDKIEYIVVDEFPNGCKNAWDREYFQRNAIANGIKEAKKDDILMISDLDEIISPYGVKSIKELLKKNPSDILNMELLNFWYFVNYVDQKLFFLGAPKACTIERAEAMTPQTIRECKNVRNVPCAGWHFSYMGGMETIKKKVKAFSHQEYNTDEWLADERIEQMIREGKDLFDRGISDFVSLPICYLLPEDIVQNRYKYEKYICDYRPISKAKFMRLKLKYLFETSFLRGIYKVVRNVKKIK